ncbi:MAG: hypothetical protein LH481_13230 [Burkholderiales bacterium]|nr:hypothetical protein [Burkholderiales bacterium]
MSFRWWGLWKGSFFHCAFVLRAGLVVAVGFMALTAASTESDLLEPERAFQLSARFSDHKTVELNYKIADGYYLYRPRFKFAPEPTTSAKFGIARFSKGKMKQDPTFGWVETYRDSVSIFLPVAMLETHISRGQPLRLKITSQGCADAGICYPPFQQVVSLQYGSLALAFPEPAANIGTDRPVQSTAPQNAPTSSLSELLRKPK